MAVMQRKLAAAQTEVQQACDATAGVEQLLSELQESHDAAIAVMQAHVQRAEAAAAASDSTVQQLEQQLAEQRSASTASCPGDD
jgi:hypothetical protein